MIQFSDPGQDRFVVDSLFPYTAGIGFLFFMGFFMGVSDGMGSRFSDR